MIWRYANRQGFDLLGLANAPAVSSKSLLSKHNYSGRVLAAPKTEKGKKKKVYGIRIAERSRPGTHLPSLYPSRKTPSSRNLSCLCVCSS